MIEFLALLVLLSAVLGVHVASRRFVRRRLWLTRFVDRPALLALAAGGAAAVAAAPMVALLPVAGSGTAVLLGVGVGTGAGLGARDGRPARTDPAV